MCWRRLGACHCDDDLVVYISIDLLVDIYDIYTYTYMRVCINLSVVSRHVCLSSSVLPRSSSTVCNTLQHTVTHCHTLRRTVLQCDTAVSWLPLPLPFPPPYPHGTRRETHLAQRSCFWCFVRACVRLCMGVCVFVCDTAGSGRWEGAYLTTLGQSAPRRRPQLRQRWRWRREVESEERRREW